MHSRDYRRFYRTKNKELLKLPPDEYTIDVDAEDGAGTRTIAMDKAKAAAAIATSAKRFSVLVTGGDSISAGINSK